MNYQWDPSKAESNRRKHGISFSDATSVFMDDMGITIEDDYPDEERFVTIGSDALGRILVVVYTYHDSDIRLISARKATRYERSQYEGES
ncbi:MAG: BrnT family toxin [Chloroflexota bacterium]